MLCPFCNAKIEANNTKKEKIAVECPKCKNFEVIGSKKELKMRTIEGWDSFDGHSPHRPGIDSVKIMCNICGAKASRIADVGNPWLDAGIVAFSTLQYNKDRNYWKLWFPANLICESLPGQFRNWFYSMLTMSTILEEKTSFASPASPVKPEDDNCKYFLSNHLEVLEVEVERILKYLTRRKNDPAYMVIFHHIHYPIVWAV